MKTPAKDAAPRYGVTTVTCSFCHAEARAGERWCATCGHRADVPRLLCNCPVCSGARAVTVICTDREGA